jgi:hypothetical protein
MTLEEILAKGPPEWHSVLKLAFEEGRLRGRRELILHILDFFEHIKRGRRDVTENP